MKLEGWVNLAAVLLLLKFLAGLLGALTVFQLPRKQQYKTLAISKLLINFGLLQILFQSPMHICTQITLSTVKSWRLFRASSGPSLCAKQQTKQHRQKVALPWLFWFLGWVLILTFTTEDASTHVSLLVCKGHSSTPGPTQEVMFNLRGSEQQQWKKPPKSQHVSAAPQLRALWAPLNQQPHVGSKKPTSPSLVETSLSLEWQVDGTLVHESRSCSPRPVSLVKTGTHTGMHASKPVRKTTVALVGTSWSWLMLGLIARAYR